MAGCRQQHLLNRTKSVFHHHCNSNDRELYTVSQHKSNVRTKGSVMVLACLLSFSFSVLWDSHYLFQVVPSQSSHPHARLSPARDLGINTPFTHVVFTACYSRGLSCHWNIVSAIGIVPWLHVRFYACFWCLTFISVQTTCYQESPLSFCAHKLSQDLPLGLTVPAFSLSWKINLFELIFCVQQVSPHSTLCCNR